MLLKLAFPRLNPCLWALVCFFCLTLHGNAFAQWGGGQPGGDYAGYGGGFGGYGGYGMGGYGGYYGGYNGYSGGYYSGTNNFGYGSYAQPLYTSFNQPNFNYYRQPLYTNRALAVPAYGDAILLRQFGSPSRTYSGSSPVMTTPNLSAQNLTLSNTALRQTDASFDQGEVVIFSPPTNEQEVQYTLNGASYTMKPGTVQRFTNDRTWTIEVTLGNGTPTKYTLGSGHYKFKQTETGMSLYTTADSPETPLATADAGPDDAADVPAPSPMPDE
ncbi:hypothetical protein [Schlesneria sp. DSM 10557]|uniref:hypothetical protein n=1 Tax=Schlesneria sp. DSM 10557 TaxID=3044399 RepID=UPI0035A1ADDD